MAQNGLRALAACTLLALAVGTSPPARLDRRSRGLLVPATTAMPSTSDYLEPAAWLGVSVAAGSQALIVFSALPVTISAKVRRAVSAFVTLAVLVAFNGLTTRFEPVPVRTRKQKVAVSPSIHALLGEAASLLAIVAAGWASASTMHIGWTSASASELERTAVAGTVVAAALFRAASRQQVAGTLVVPFAAFLAHSYAYLLRLMGSTSAEGYQRAVSYVSVSAFVSGLVSVTCLAALAAERRRCARCQRPQLPGIEPITELAVFAQLVWTFICLATWALSRAPPFGFALVASALTGT
mmetsp:Transcript_20087/g.47162  ORF Transcript_20087/g.47162 Transcript_20087/m.47162 type:complete len:297 (-) Transcript_20087:748-1638(-)